jgi:hypothetical protein
VYFNGLPEKVGWQFISVHHPFSVRPGDEPNALVDLLDAEPLTGQRRQFRAI